MLPGACIADRHSDAPHRRHVRHPVGALSLARLRLVLPAETCEIVEQKIAGIEADTRKCQDGRHYRHLSG